MESWTARRAVATTANHVYTQRSQNESSGRLANTPSGTPALITLDEQIKPMEDRGMKTLALLVCASLVGISAVSDLSGESQPADADRYGPYPANYKEIVTKWLGTQLIDAASARIEWNGDPKPADLGTNGEHLYGYLVNFKVDARNRFGTYTGMQSHGALIRNGEVIKGLGFGY
jgi:hypothetical protein